MKKTYTNWDLIYLTHKPETERDVPDAELVTLLAKALQQAQMDLQGFRDADKAKVWEEAYSLGRSRKMVENPYQDQNLYGQ